MTNRSTQILHDVYINLAVSLPLSQVAAIHGCSRSYVSQVYKSYGLKVDRKNGTITAPISTLNEVFWPRRNQGDT